MKNLLPISPEQIYAVILCLSGLLTRYLIYRRDCYRRRVTTTQVNDHHGHGQLFQQTFMPFLKIFAWLLTLFGVFIFGMGW
jgi:hypothetical protein